MKTLVRTLRMLLPILLVSGLAVQSDNVAQQSGKGPRLAPGAIEQPASATKTEAKTLAGQPISEYRLRREKLMEQTEDGIVLLSGALEEEFGEVGRFRQRNYFMYLTGVEVPGAFLALIPQGYGGSEVREVLFLPTRNPARERWTGPKIGPGEEGTREFGVQRVLPTSDLDSELKRMVENTKIIYTVVPSGPSGRFSLEQAFVERVCQNVPEAEVRDVRPMITRLRGVKSPVEIEMLRQAIRITGEAHKDLVSGLSPGLYEYQMEALVMAAYLRNGAMRPGFPPIIGSGPNATVLHYNANNRQMAEGDLVVVDIGAEYNYYSADITRTYPVSGRFTRRQRQIYELVLGAQKAAQVAFKPGQTTVRDLQRAAREFMRSSPLRSKDGQTLDRSLIHGISHAIGMDVHDVGDFSRALSPGMVITLEPGIYLPDENVGVRIEDDYLVTETGLIKLSADIPSSPDEIEKIMARAHRLRSSSVGGKGASSSSQFGKKSRIQNPKSKI